MLQKLLMSAALVCMSCGCSHLQNVPAQRPPPGDTDKIQLRNNAAGLLYDLLGDEKNVGKVLIVKNAGKEVTVLIKLISATAAANEKELEQLAGNDPGLNLKAMSLPPGETAARAAIAKSKEYDLLFSSGANFEFNLLMTQAEAQNYGWHMAKVAAENSPRPQEAMTFKVISEAMKHLYEQTVAQMRSLPVQ
jgi:hypothetical protein